MDYVVSKKMIKDIEKYLFDSNITNSLELMSDAVDAIFQEVIKRFDPSAKFLVLAGEGNNGADAMLLASKLKIKGFKVAVYQTEKPKTKEALIQEKLILTEDIEIISDSMIKNFIDKHADVIIDGVYGIGCRLPLSNKIKELFEFINSKNKYVIAIDVPSGINVDNANKDESALNASLTVCLGFVKKGMLFYPAKKVVSEIVLKDIGFKKRYYESLKLEEQMNITCFINKKPPELLSYLNEDIHKTSNGNLLIIAGSKTISGAPFFSAKAAFRSGIGLVNIFTHNENKTILGTLLPEAIINTYTKDEKNIEVLNHLIQKSTAIIIGPGIGIENYMQDYLRIVLESKKRVVIDADGINILSANKQLRGLLHEDVVITPHLKEMSRFANKEITEIKEDLINNAKCISDKYKIAVILKDSVCVAVKNNDAYINTTGNQGMATAGMGDVLAGIVGALIAKKDEDLFKMCCTALYMHGYAGDLAAKKMSKRSMMASDVIEGLKYLD